MLEAITFDCWSTLITDRDFQTAADARVQALMDIGGIDRDRAEQLLNDGWRLHHQAWLRGEQAGAPAIAASCGDRLDLSPSDVAELTTAIEDAGALSGRVEALDGAVDTLRTLREAGLRTALVCDAGMTPGRVVRGLLDSTGLLEHLEYCAFSDEVGVPKPHAKIFEVALDAIDVEPARAAHVGDLIRTDVLGAHRMGMTAVRITAEHDDATEGFSAASIDDLAGIEDAHTVVGSHAELVTALADLGAALS